MPCRTGLNSDFSTAGKRPRAWRRSRPSAWRRSEFTVAGTGIRSHTSRMPPMTNLPERPEPAGVLPPAHYLNKSLTIDSRLT
jgi:hypothetical protein